MPKLTTKDVDSRVSKHEAVCAERYTDIMFRMARVEKIVMGTAGALIAGMAMIIWQTLQH
jgi:hypothetical protein